MEIEVKREPSGPQGTFGKLYIEGHYQCETLEDVVREVEGKPVAEWKIKGETAIPRGRYRVIINHSNRFKRELPLLLNVPGYEGVRIHPGNTHEHTEGCLLVGTARSVVGLLNSRLAFNELQGEIAEAIAHNEQVFISLE